MSNLVTDIELLDLENKLRAMISELVTPVVHKAAEHDLLIKKSLSKGRKNKAKLDEIDNELRKKIARLVPVEEFHKRIEGIANSANQRFESGDFKLAEYKLRLDECIYDAADSKFRIKNVEDKLRKLLSGVDENYRHMNEFKELLSLENLKYLTELHAFTNQQGLKNDEALEKINKLSTRINEINSKALPEIVCLIEKRNFEISEVKIKLREGLEERVLKKDFLFMSNRLDGEVAKTNENVSREIRDLKEFLDKMLRVEVSCGITEALLTFLDSRHLKKLIPFTENKLAEGFLELKKKDFQLSTNDSVTIDYLYTKTKDYSKYLVTNIASAKDRITQEDKKAPKLLSSSTLKKLDVTSKTSSVNIELISPVRASREFIKEPCVDFTSPAHRIDSSKEYIVLDSPQLKVNKDLISREVDRMDSHSQLMSSRSLEPQFIQEQIEKIQSELSNVFNKLEYLEKGNKNELVQIEGLVVKFQQDLGMSLSVLTQEYKHLNKLRVKEAGETGNRLEILQKTFKEVSQELNKLSINVADHSIAISNQYESIKVIQSLMLQDEEDKQSLQLSCFTEKKAKTKSPSKKNVVSLKPECLSCSAQNSIAYSAFKMACLNYYPSDVVYNSKSFSRKDLIKKITEMLGDTLDISTPDDPASLNMTETVPRTKSAGRVKNDRKILDASYTRSFFTNESPVKRISVKTHVIKL